MANIADLLNKKNEKDLASLRKGRSGVLRLLALFTLCVVTVFYFATVIFGGSGDPFHAAQRSREDVLAINQPWSDDLVQLYDDYRGWFEKHGTASEAAVFDRIAASMFNSIADSDDEQLEEYEFTLLGKLIIAFEGAVLRVAFVVIACLRFWVVALGFGGLIGWFSFRAHKGHDLLGESGNGRLFYSGARIRLEAGSQSGATDRQITGLACPRQLPEHKTRSSDLGRLLARYGADNPTNIALAGVILAHAETPAYVTTSDEQTLLDEFFAGAGLAENAFLVIEKALTLLARFQSDAIGDLPALEQPPVKGRLDRYQNSNLLERALHRVLTPRQRRQLAELRPSQVATALLAVEAGKSMAYAKEAGRWLRKSTFPHLCSRSVLHSIAFYARDYDYGERMDIRRALVYALRSSPLGPVRFPVDLSDRSFALRQWVEILLACPHELQARADEIELFAIMREGERGWSEKLIDAVLAMRPEAVEDVFALYSGAFFMPLAKVLALCREVLSSAQIRRLEELVYAVSQRQKLHAMSLDFPNEGERGGVPQHERIFAPFSFTEVKMLAERHGLPTDDIKDWSALRVMFNHFGWLGRRVGDHTVPDASLVFAVFAPSPTLRVAGLSEGLIGVQGVVVFRATRLEAKWGKQWSSRFRQAESAVIAENRDDYENAMSGKREPAALIEAGDSETSAIA